jgi:putative DNA primase/helicase
MTTSSLASLRREISFTRFPWEWPGILAWAIAGCLEWQRIGLAPPCAVVDATKEYLEAEDALAAWMKECCVLHGTLHTGSSALFASWKVWAEAAGETAGSQKRFSQALKARGFQDRRLSNDTAGLLGIGLKAPQQTGRYGRDD